MVWATSRAFAGQATAAIEAALRRRRDLAETAHDVVEMRALMTRERPAAGFWDLKLSPGGLVDIEFCAQFLQLAGAADGGPLRQNTAEALTALAAAQPARANDIAILLESWRLQQSASQLLKIALDDGDDPAAEPAAFRTLLARIAGRRTFPALVKAIASARAATLEVSGRLIV